jgi:5'-nucleotidase / UDP-sugar diphosphatase
MKWTFAPLLVLSLAVVGCQNDKQSATQNAALTPTPVTDITPAVAPAPAPVAQQPAAAESQAAPAAAQQPAAGGKYTVKKGDTLWKIAAANYGNGNQWQKITSANPGLTAETLKAGQTIVLP